MPGPEPASPPPDQAEADESIRHEASGDRGRFALEAGGAEAELTYRMDGAVMAIDHTFTPPAMRGHGVAGRLMRRAVAHARGQGLKIRPVCSYAAAWMRRHSEAQDLLDG